MKRICGNKILSLALGLIIAFGASTVVFEQSKVSVMADVSNEDKLIPIREFGSDETGFMNNKGEVVIPYQFDDGGYFTNGLAPVEKDKKWGFIDTTGKLVIPYQFDEVQGFLEGLSPVKKDGEWGYINTSGYLTIPHQFDDASHFLANLAPVEKDGKYGYINVNGNVVIPYQFDYAASFIDDLAMVEKNGKFGYINTSGDLVIPYQFDKAWSFTYGLAKVEKDGKSGYVNTTGDLVIPYQFDKSNSFFRGLTPVKKDNKWGYINTSGDLVIPYQFDDAWSFVDELARVKKDGKYGYINTSGEVVIPYQFDEAFEFSYGFAIVRKFEGIGLINTKGEFFRNKIKMYTPEYVSLEDYEVLKDTIKVTPTKVYDNGDVTIKFGSNTDASKYNVVVTPVNTNNSNVYNELITYNDINENLLSKTLSNINVKDNGNDIYTFDNSLTLVFNLSDVDLKNVDTSKLICIFINKDTNKIEYIGGRYDSNKKSFTTETKNINGNFAVVYGNTDYYNQAVLTPGDTKFLSNGTVQVLDTAPVNINGTIYVPVRAIFETLGATVSFETATKTAIISLDGKTVKFRDDESIDGAPAPVIINSRMLVPIRYVSEAIGANVIWYPEDKVIQITK